MAWSATNTIPAMQGKTSALKELFAKVANAALEKGQTQEEAIFSGMSAVKIQEKKNQPPKPVKPKVPAHLEAVRSLSGSPYEMTSKAANPQPPTQALSPSIQAVEFDNEGHLVVLMPDGRRIVTKGKAGNQVIDQKIGISVNPVFDHVQMNTTANYTAEDYEPGMLTWNEFEDCLDIVQHDGSVLQVGLENYIQVINNTGVTIQNGSVVKFSGVALEEIPEVNLMVADGSVEPLYIVGVVTNTLIPGQVGRATILGKVRRINTTGSDVGETWQRGDLLWAHPSQPGKLTKFRPTAPSVSVSIAAVLKSDATAGILLVRPTIFPRLFYGTFSSNTTQSAPVINTPHQVHFENTEIASGVELVDGGKITTRYAGLYSFDFRLQLTSNNSSQKNIYIWARKNGNDIPLSASKATLVGNGVELVPSWSFTVSMQPNDYFELMFAVDDPAILINAPAPTAFCPSTPSATLRVSQINL